MTLTLRSRHLAASILWLGFLSIGAPAAAQPTTNRPGEGPSDVRCGSYCLFIALEALGLAPEGFEALEEALGPPDPRGYSMGQLQRQAEASGATTLAVKTSVENLSRRASRESFCCIAYLDEDSHYVMLSDADGNSVSVVDPPRSYELPAETLRSLWGGEALLLSTGPLTPEADLGSRGRLVVRALIGVAGIGLVAGMLYVARTRRASGQSGPGAGIA